MSLRPTFLSVDLDPRVAMSLPIVNYGNVALSVWFYYCTRLLQHHVLDWSRLLSLLEDDNDEWQIC